MKKQILNLGKALTKAEQKQVNGGKLSCPEVTTQAECALIGGYWTGLACIHDIYYCADF